jgi:hypothetical protein
MESDKDIFLCICGGAGKFPAALGACYRLNKYIKKTHPSRTIKYGGVSSGTIVALALATATTEENLRKIFIKFTEYFDSPLKIPLTYWYDATRLLIRDLLQDENGYQKINNKLYIAYTKIGFNGPEYEIVSEFNSNKHLEDTIIAAITLFPLSWTPVRLVNGHIGLDGGFINNSFELEDHYNVVFDYSLLGQTITVYDWFLSLSIDKFDSLYHRSRNVIKSNKHEFKTIIKHEKPLVTLTNNKFFNFDMSYVMAFLIMFLLVRFKGKISTMTLNLLYRFVMLLKYKFCGLKS